MEDNYLIEGELAFKSYSPKKLEVGMTFLSRISVGVLEPQFLFFTLEAVPEEEELFMSLYGAPVHLCLISSDGEEENWADEHSIGWFDACMSEDCNLIPITDHIINKIINDFNGRVDVACDEDGEIIYYEGKVILSYLEEEDEDEHEHNHIWENEDE